jgi:ABC-2 type transport system ATP-binding protein
MLPFKNRRASALSGGMKQKLALSVILLASPQLIILDEPTTGVDPLSRIEFFAIIEDLKREGRTILISTPYLDEAEKGDHIVFIKKGRVLRQESIDELKRNFPARLFRIRPEDNPLAALERWHESGSAGGALFLRGQYLRYLQESPEQGMPAIPMREVTEQEPTLEDIYIYYERHAD